MKKPLLIILIITTLFASGCWDMIEINDRIYPYTLGYDVVDSAEGRYKITYTYPNIAALGKNPSSDVKTFIMDTNANNLFEAMHRLTTKSNGPIFLKHLKVVLMSDEVASDAHMVREIADGLSRDFIANKNAEMLVVKQSANKLLASVNKFKRQETTEGILYSLLLNRHDSTMFTPITLTNFVEFMDLSNCAIVPLAHLDNDEILIDGGAVFKNYKLIGYLTYKENRAMAYLNNQVREDGIDTTYNGADLSLMISNVNSKKKLINKSDTLKIKYDIELEGHIHSYIIGDSIETEKDLEDMQNHVSKVVTEELESAIEKVQKELKVDSLFLANYFFRYHPNLWDEIKDNWEEIYPDIEIELNVKVFIRRRGLTK